MRIRDLKGKYIWIVGASSGMGAALAKELAARGAIIALSARREDKLMELSCSLSGEGHIICPLDVSVYETVKIAEAKILKNFPYIDIAIFMSALYFPQSDKNREILDIQQLINVNLIGAFNFIDSVKKQFEKQSNGLLVLCASVAGYRGLPNGQPYSATKAALINLGESLKLDLESKNIDVKIICPGFVKTPLTDKNDFNMPMIIEADEAACLIAEGLISSRFEIHFPKKFTLLMKAIRILPYSIYFWLVRRIV